MHGTCHNSLDIELVGDLGNGKHSVAKPLHGFARDYEHILDIRELANDYFVNTSGEIGIVGIRTQVLERQYRDRVLVTLLCLGRGGELSLLL